MNHKNIVIGACIVVSSIVGLGWMMLDKSSIGTDTSNSGYMSGFDKNSSEHNNATPESTSRATVSSTTLSREGEAPDKKAYDDKWCNNLELTESAKLKAGEEHKNWLRDHGYLLEEREVYESYGEETLKELARTGDLTALEVLSDSSDKEVRMSAAREAAIYGSTGTAIMPIVVDFEIRARQLKKEGKPKEAKNMLLKSFAWQEYAALRGDYTHVKGTVHRLQKGNTVMEVKPEDHEKISAMANEIYSDLNEERLSRGLPPFDEDQPKVVENLNSLLVASLKIDGWDGWGAHLPAKGECVEQNIKYLTSKS